MTDNTYETLTAFFPDLNIDDVLDDFPDVPIENLANILYEIPPYMNTYRKPKEDPILRTETPPPFEEPEAVINVEPPQVDLTDELCKKLVARLREDLATAKMAPLVAFEKLLKSTFLTLKPEFFTHCVSFAQNRPISEFIIAFLVFNNLSDRLINIVPQSHELFKHVELKEIAKPPQPITKNLEEAGYKNVNEILDVLKTYDKIIDLETLVLTHQFTCGICREQHSNNVAVSCDFGLDAHPDGDGDAVVVHKFCPKCIQSYTNLSAEELPFSEGGAGLKCIELNCQRPIYISKIRSLLSKHVINRLDNRILADNLIILGIQIERCENCNYAVELENSKNVSKVFACPMCDKAKCRLCNADWDDDHFGITCQELADKLKKEKRDKYMNEVYVRMNEVIFRKCHKCNLQFVKVDGCNSMKCRCGATQCYVCRAKNIDYTHFCTHTHDPVLRRCNRCTKCSLLVDATVADRATVTKLEEEAANTSF